MMSLSDCRQESCANQVCLFVLTLHNRNRHQGVLDPPPPCIPVLVNPRAHNLGNNPWLPQAMMLQEKRSNLRQDMLAGRASGPRRRREIGGLLFGRL